MNEFYDFLDEDIYNQDIDDDSEYQLDSLYDERILNQQETFPQAIQGNINLPNIGDNPGNMNENCGMFNSEEGFIRGNMFPDLFDPYKRQQLRRINPTNEQERLMLNIQMLDFAMKDINLYLDIHPNDNCMIRKFNEYLNRKNRALDEYQTKFGPIVLSMPNNSLEKSPWAWTQTKSPWERGM